MVHPRSGESRFLANEGYSAEVLTSEYATRTLMKDTVVVGGVTAPNQAIISSTSLSTTVLDIPSDA